MIQLRRSSAELMQTRWARLKALAGGIHSPAAIRRLRKMLRTERPDVVHVHNVFPLISPSALAVCRQEKVPVVMSVHNFRLMCPTGLSVRNGDLCELCWSGREWWCVLRNCENHLLRSGAYALRNWVARIRGSFLRNVTVYAPLTEFHRNRLIAAGLPAERMVVLPNMGPESNPAAATGKGTYIAFAGRITPAKGVDVLLQAAAKLPGVPFRLAGASQDPAGLRGRLPSNAKYVGMLPREQMQQFLAGSRIVALPSTWPEGFPIVLLEAMAAGKPVVASRTGGLGEIVSHGETGMLVPRGDPDQLAEAIRQIWYQPDLCESLGRAGRQRLERNYSRQRHYDRLISIYARAIALGPGGVGRNRTRTTTTRQEAVDAA